MMTSMSDKIRIGVIGLGTMGEQDTRIYQSHPLAEVTAIADSKPERLEEVGDRYGIADIVRASSKSSPAPVDAGCLSTPDFTHYAPVKDPAMAAFPAGAGKWP